MDKYGSNKKLRELIKKFAENSKSLTEKAPASIPAKAQKMTPEEIKEFLQKRKKSLDQAKEVGVLTDEDKKRMKRRY